jgi:hypothetical protein
MAWKGTYVRIPGILSMFFFAGPDFYKGVNIEEKGDTVQKAV